ncbi:Peptide deformylase [Anaerovibrio sp. JC8]|uniref:peptide deformylase n=1 Tax=Anaerovibrio sp. JC8 TaxID=1240085 RepID=UPI000A0C9434|nr:peptide deformylase [Anaerovibrio sp. JC8]ORT98837.1 Peptide deformylase [Anaerovibrio sp. JC8]
MVKEIMKDLLFLGHKAETATKEDIAIAKDLLDTLAAHREHCVGMAANMIGERKAIIAIAEGEILTAILNPVLVKNSPRTYKATEGCLSIPGEREVERHEWVEVKYRDINWNREKRKFTGFEAEIIQHELDHLEGKLV